MRTPTLLCVFSLLAVLGADGRAQQEANDATGALRHFGADPTAGTPFVVPSVGGFLQVETSGIPQNPYLLLLGSYLLNGLPQSVLGGQIINLDVAQGVTVVGDGIGGSGVLPSAMFQLDLFGNSTLSFPTSTGLAGNNYAFQAMTLDPALHFGLNITAAVDLTVVNKNVIDVYANLVATNVWPAGDDGIYTYQYITGPYFLFGQPTTHLTISSNGWIRFDANADNSQAFGTAAEFEAGTVGVSGTTPTPAPLMTTIWGDLDFSGVWSFTGAPGTIVLTEDFDTQTVRIDYSGGGYIFLGSSLGSYSVILDFSSVVPVIQLDFTNLDTASAFGGTITGISDGDIGLPQGANVEADLVTNGVVNPFNSGGDFGTYYQDFMNGSTPEIEDLSGTIITFTDLSSTASGHWSVN